MTFVARIFRPLMRMRLFGPDRTRRHRGCYACMLIVALLACVQVQATTIDPMPWEQFAFTADFIGEVECTTAGGIVARYRVIEVWKGERQPNDMITIRIAPNYWEPQYPLSLVGQRFIVAGFTNRAPDTRASDSSGGGIALWWRELPADYRLPLFQGIAASDDTGALRFALGTSRTSAQELRADIDALLHSADAEREYLRALALREFAGSKRRQEAARAADLAAAALLPPDTAASQESSAEMDDTQAGNDQAQSPDDAMLAPVLEAPSATAIATLLLEGARIAQESVRWKYARILRSGGPATKRVAAAFQWATFGDSDAMDFVRAQLLEDTPQAPVSADSKRAVAVPDQRTLRRWRAALPNEESASWDEALKGLTQHEPERVARWLLTGTHGDLAPSWFGHKCVRDCALHLGRLADSASDPWVRAAASIYLSFHDEQAGRLAMRAASGLPGDAGAWAALALARRGENAALARAALLFEAPNQPAILMTSVPHGNLRKRFLELLSNSAAAIGERFVVPSGENEEEVAAAERTSVRALLQRHPDLAPVDPWLDALRAQRID